MKIDNISLDLDKYSYIFLQACQQFSLYKNEMFNLLAATIGIEKHQIFYQWCYRKIKQSGSIDNSDWKYFFHGLECDFRHKNNNEKIIIEFGPNGRIDTFTNFGLFLFITTQENPSIELVKIKKFLTNSVASDKSNSMQAMIFLDQQIKILENNEFIEKAEIEYHKYTNNDNKTDDELYFDSQVFHRKIISSKGFKHLSNYIAR